MPYIEKPLRQRAFLDPDGAGELAFKLSQVFEQYVVKDGDRFFLFAEIVGATILSLLDYYTRIIEPYERRKQEENGDVYAPR